MKTNTNNFVFQPLGPEMMVYDKQHDKVHILGVSACPQAETGKGYAGNGK
jgi:hypothetical protein